MCADEIESKKDTRYSFCFNIFTTRADRKFVFCGDKQSDALGWIEFLNEFIDEKVISKYLKTKTQSKSMLKMDNEKERWD